MDEAQRRSLEDDIRQRAAAGDHEGAATAALRGYGPELFAFLHACHRDEDDAGEVFSQLGEAIWRGLPTFEWRSSFRTWAFAISRRLSMRLRRDAHQRRKRLGGAPEGGAIAEIAEIADRVRTETLSYLRTGVRDRIAALRDALPEEDRALLVLRVDRQLAWNDLAQVLRGEEAPLEGEALKRESARLRKRFQVIKDELRAAAQREGLIDPGPRGGA